MYLSHFENTKAIQFERYSLDSRIRTTLFRRWSKRGHAGSRPTPSRCSRDLVGLVPRSLTSTFLVFVALSVQQVAADESILHYAESSEFHMGTRFRVSFYAANSKIASQAMRRAFQRIRQLDNTLSIYIKGSELNQLCDTCPHARPVHIGQDLWNVLVYSEQLAKQSQGAFDVTVGPLTKLWRRARRRKQLPDPLLLEKARRSVGYRHVRLLTKSRSVQLLQQGMQLDLGGIAKGYAADAALRELTDLGITRASVDAGGDLALADAPPNQSGWRVVIDSLDADRLPEAVLNLTNVSVATSGDKWQFVEIGGIRYSHIIDPRTGIGVASRISSTVIAKDCMTADGLASALSVMGAETGMRLVEGTDDASALLFAQTKHRIDRFATPRFAQYLNNDAQGRE